MKRIFKLAILTMVIALLSACNNVDKPTYNGNNSDSSLQNNSENNELILNNNSDSLNFGNSNSVSDNSFDTTTSSDESNKQSGQEITSSGSVSSNGNVSQNGTSADSSQAVSGISDGHTHQFKGATCTEPKTCLICGVTEGEPKHRWKAATCIEPKTCVECKKQEGKLAAHIYIGSECNVCHQRNPDFEYVQIESTNWVAHIINDSSLYRVVIDLKSATPNISYTLFTALSETAECDQNLLYVYKEQRYIKESSSEQSKVTVVDRSDVVEFHDKNGGILILDRVSEDNLVVSGIIKKIIGYEKFLTKGVTFVPLDDK